MAPIRAGGGLGEVWPGAVCPSPPPPDSQEGRPVERGVGTVWEGGTGRRPWLTQISSWTDGCRSGPRDLDMREVAPSACAGTGREAISRGSRVEVLVTDPVACTWWIAVS